MGQQQMQQSMQSQSSGGPPGGTQNAFPQAYGSYPMNPSSGPGGYYGTNPGSTNQSQGGQQNPSFSTGYQNYPYSQAGSDN